jgi:hypothetical protein
VDIAFGKKLKIELAPIVIDDIIFPSLSVSPKIIFLFVV